MAKWKKNGEQTAVVRPEEAGIPDTTPEDVKAAFGPPATEGFQIIIPQVKIIHRSEMFEMPDGDAVKKITGIILDVSDVNAWWEIPFDESGGGTPPDCFSLNSIHPDPTAPALQAEKCRSCPQNQFGSDKRKRGKACKNMKRIHILVEGDRLPRRITAPPTSLRAVNEYLSSLWGRGEPFQSVITEFSLKGSTNRDGVAYSELQMKRAGISCKNAEEAKQLISFIEQMKPAIKGQPFTEDEYPVEDQPGAEETFA